ARRHRRQRRARLAVRRARGGRGLLPLPRAAVAGAGRGRRRDRVRRRSADRAAGVTALPPRRQGRMTPGRFDLIVVGAGSAGREAATRARVDHGARVAVVEHGLWGGSCANVACKPTKQYVTAAELLASLRAAADLGVHTGAVAFDLAALKARTDWLVGTQEAWR